MFPYINKRKLIILLNRKSCEKEVVKELIIRGIYICIYVCVFNTFIIISF